MPKMTKLIVQTPAYDPAVSHRALRQSCTKTTGQCIFFLAEPRYARKTKNQTNHRRFEFFSVRSVSRSSVLFGFRHASRVRLVRFVVAEIKQDSSSVRSIRFVAARIKQNSSSVRTVRFVVAQIKQNSSSVCSVRFVVLVVHIKQNSTSVRSVRVHLCC